MNQDDLKRAAARAALAELVPGTLVGVGTGSTVNFFIDALGETPERYAGAVSSSERSTDRLRAAGITVFDLNPAVQGGLPRPVYVDGADEIDPGRHMIKGGGGALTREKILAEASREFVCIVDQRKEVAELGRYPLPVEVIPMARTLVTRQLQALGATVAPRAGFRTDNGNLILDASGLRIADPAGLEARINQWPGVVTVGLFARRRADVLLVATPGGVRETRLRETRRAPVQPDGGT